MFGGYVSQTMTPNGNMVELSLFDTMGQYTSQLYIIYALLIVIKAGQEDYDRLRPLSYTHAHVIVLVFAIDAPDAFANIEEKVYLIKSTRNCY